MVEPNPALWWKSFLALPNGDRRKSLGMAFLVAVICGLAVSTAAVSLRPLIAANVESQRQARMAAMLADLPGVGEILAEAGTGAVDLMLVDLRTGEPVGDIDPSGYDALAAAADSAASTPLSRADDIAGLGRRENIASVYLLRSNGALALLVLPIRGTGYGGLIKAYLALEADLSTVAALTIYEQTETPGLGGRIAEPEWQAQWAGKQVKDEGEIVIEVVRGDAAGVHEVAGISGASITGYAIADMIQFWLGPLGFGRFLQKLEAGEIS